MNYCDERLVGEIVSRYPSRKVSLRNIWPRFKASQGALEFRPALVPGKGYVLKEAVSLFPKGDRREVVPGLLCANIERSAEGAPLYWKRANKTAETLGTDGSYLAVLEEEGGSGRIELEIGKTRGGRERASVRFYGEEMPAGSCLAIYSACEIYSAIRR